MWDAIATVLTSSNGFKTEIIVILALVAFLLAAKFNLISISGKFLRVGVIKDNERRILREQINYMSAVIDAEVRSLPMDQLDFYRTKYVLSKVKDFFEQMIIFNHITDSAVYIESKQLQLYSMVYNLTENPVFKSDEMKQHIYQLCEDMIKKVLSIRKEYS